MILAPGTCSVLIGASNVAIVPAIGGYGVEDIYLGEFSPTFESNWWPGWANLTVTTRVFYSKLLFTP